MRVSLVASIGVMTTALAVAACGGLGTVTELSVGNTLVADGGDDAPPLTATPDATPTTTLMERLEARCAAPSGQIDTFTSAAQLTAHLSRRWYHCTSNDPSTNWSLPKGTGLVFDFSLAGTWAFLDYAPQPQTFTASTDADRSGQVLYYILVGAPPEAGTTENDGGVAMDAGAFSSNFVPVDDTLTRNGLFVELTRGDFNDYLFQPSFEKNPTKLQLDEMDPTSGTPVRATFVPID